MGLRLAVVAALHNEKDFLRHFLSYYSGEADEIRLIDNESDDGSLEGLSTFPRVVLSSYASDGKFDEYLKHRVVLEKAKECAGRFDYVLMLDPDEFVVPKRRVPIRQAIEESGCRDVYGTDGWNIFGYPWDAPYDPSKPLFVQRQWGIRNAYYSKPILFRPELELEFSLGNHCIMNRREPRLVDPNQALFWLFHYRAFDEEVYVRRALSRARRVINAGHPYLGRTEADFRKSYAYYREELKPQKCVPDGLSYRLL